MSDMEREIFGIAGIVYPGHPLALALLVTRVFPSLEAATFKSGDYPRALSDCRIPGAGSNVYAALDLLRCAKRNSVDAAIEYGATYWRTSMESYPNAQRAVAGQQQADSIEAVFRSTAGTWLGRSALSSEGARDMTAAAQ